MKQAFILVLAVILVTVLILNLYACGVHKNSFVLRRLAGISGSQQFHDVPLRASIPIHFEDVTIFDSEPPQYSPTHRFSASHSSLAGFQMPQELDQSLITETLETVTSDAGDEIQEQFTALHAELLSRLPDYLSYLQAPNTIVIRSEAPRSVNLFVPFFGRAETLRVSLAYLTQATTYFNNNSSHRLHLIYIEIGGNCEPSVDFFLDEVGVGPSASSSFVEYYCIPHASPSFPKSLAYNLAFLLAKPAVLNVFHDLDMIMEESFFFSFAEAFNTLQTKLSSSASSSSASPNWMWFHSTLLRHYRNLRRQPPDVNLSALEFRRRTPYFQSPIGGDAEQNQREKANKNLKERELPLLSSLDFSEDPGVISPGGSIWVSYDLFVKVGGFDPEFFFGYGPEDSFFLGKLEFIQSRFNGSGKTTSPSELSANTDQPFLYGYLYHLYHDSKRHIYGQWFNSFTMMESLKRDWDNLEPSQKQLFLAYKSAFLSLATKQFGHSRPTQLVTSKKPIGHRNDNIVSSPLITTEQTFWTKIQRNLSGFPSFTKQVEGSQISILSNQYKWIDNVGNIASVPKGEKVLETDSILTFKLSDQRWRQSNSDFLVYITFIANGYGLFEIDFGMPHVHDLTKQTPQTETIQAQLSFDIQPWSNDGQQDKNENLKNEAPQSSATQKPVVRMQWNTKRPKNWDDGHDHDCGFNLPEIIPDLNVLLSITKQEITLGQPVDVLIHVSPSQYVATVNSVTVSAYMHRLARTDKITRWGQTVTGISETIQLKKINQAKPTTMQVVRMHVQTTAELK